MPSVAASYCLRRPRRGAIERPTCLPIPIRRLPLERLEDRCLLAVGPIDDPAIEEVAAAPAAGAVDFATHAISTNIRGPHSVFAADVDGDGDLDVLGGFNNDNKIVWYENDGSENFTTHIISTNTDVISVLAADMDGDGNLDVLSALFFDNTIAWYENLSPIIPELPADLTGNGFVDFEDLTVLLANWN